MTRILCFAIVLILIAPCTAPAQTINGLRQKIQEIISAKHATAGIALMGDTGSDTLSVNGDAYFPMQSVFKFPIALAMLSETDKGKFSLDQKITISKKDLLPGLYSPLRDKYPEGTTLPLSEIMEYTVSESDNAGCDALLRLIGGPVAVEESLRANGFKNIFIKYNEEMQQHHWDLQFQNRITPKEANEILRNFYDNSPKRLSEKSYAFIWKLMKGTETGKKRMRGELPADAVVAHKTGSSGANKDGLTAAVNDIGVVSLPNGGHFYISVFVSNSTEDADSNEKIIADISKAAWDYFTTRTN